MKASREKVDVIYISRPQVERWTIEELERNSNLESARRELEDRLKATPKENRSGEATKT